MTAQPKESAGPKEVFDLLAKELSFAYTKAVFFDRLFEDANLPTLDGAAPGFFSTVQEILFDDLVLTVARLTDGSSTGNNPNLTLSRLVEIVDVKLPPEVRLHLDDELCHLAAYVNALREHRNKRIAHNDLQTLRTSGGAAESALKLFGNTGLPLIGLASITDVLAIAGRVMSLVSPYVRGTPFELSAPPYITKAVSTFVQLLGRAASQPQAAGPAQQ